MLESQPLDRLRVVLVATRNPLNIGAAARAMANFGCPHLRLVTPYEESFREARSAVGAGEVLRAARAFDSVSAAVADCALVVGTTTGRDRELQQPLRPLPSVANLLRKRLEAGPVALLFGSEKRGLSNDDLSYCHWLLRIPTRDSQPSMNLGQAVAVCLYELVRAGGRAVEESKRASATARDLDRLHEIWWEALRASGYVKPRAAATEEKLRLLLRRLQLTPEDAELVTGMMRKIAGQIRRSRDSA